MSSLKQVATTLAEPSIYMDCNDSPLASGARVASPLHLTPRPRRSSPRGGRLQPGVLQLPPFADPMDAVTAAQAADPEQETLGRLLAAWKDHFGGKPTLVRALLTVHGKVKSCSRSPGYGNTAFPTESELTLSEVLDELHGVRGDLSVRSLGRALSYRKDRIISGLRLVSAGKSRDGSSLWLVEECGVCGVCGVNHTRSDFNDRTCSGDGGKQTPQTTHNPHETPHKVRIWVPQPCYWRKSNAQVGSSV